MARVNLLPWREELRKERQRQFLSILGLVFVLGLVVVFAYKYTIGLQVDAQKVRNQYLTTEIAKLESQIKEINRLEEERQKLIERMKMITSLQQSRPRIVHIFDELVRSIPEGLNLKSIERNQNTLVLEGSAESAQRVTSFMRKIDGSEWFASGSLKDIDSDSKFGASRKAFSLTIKEATMEEEETESMNANAGGGS